MLITVAPFGFNVSWAKTKLQNLGYGPQSSNITIADSTSVEGVEKFLYLGSKQTSDGHIAYCLSLDSQELPEQGLEQPTAQYQHKSPCLSRTCNVYPPLRIGDIDMSKEGVTVARSFSVVTPREKKFYYH